jgi:hypothetical protein
MPRTNIPHALGFVFERSMTLVVADKITANETMNKKISIVFISFCLNS